MHKKLNRAALLLGLLASWTIITGCQSSKPTSYTTPVAEHDANSAAAATSGSNAADSTKATKDNSESLPLREGETVKITFPGAPTLDTSQTIRPDGKITLTMMGEMKVAGLTPAELEAQLLKAYGSQLVLKEVSVVVLSSVFTIFVTGAVLRPGKLVSDRVETPLEAVIEAGIDPVKSNLKKVKIVRENANGTTDTFRLNLDAVLKGKPAPPFVFKPMDIMYVPEKFMWY